LNEGSNNGAFMKILALLAFAAVVLSGCMVVPVAEPAFVVAPDRHHHHHHRRHRGGR
jgi:hypothetical protein